MNNLKKIDYDTFKEEVCPRCDIAYEIKRRISLIQIIIDRYADVITLLTSDMYKFDAGSESAKNTYRNRCLYMQKCEEVDELLNKIESYEMQLSKLLFYFIQNDDEKEIYYISQDLSPYYQMLCNRILRTKKTNSNDKYNMQDLLDKIRRDY